MKEDVRKMIAGFDDRFDEMLAANSKMTITPQELADCIGVNVQAIRAAGREGRLPCSFAHGQRTEILKAPLYHWWYGDRGAR